MAEQSEMALHNGDDSALKPHNLHDGIYGLTFPTIQVGA